MPIISGKNRYSKGLGNSHPLVGIVLDRSDTVIILLLLLDQ